MRTQAGVNTIQMQDPDVAGFNTLPMQTSPHGTLLLYQQGGKATAEK